MRKILIVLFVIPFFSNINTFANIGEDSLSIWLAQYNEAMQLRQYAKAENAIDKILHVWKQEQNTIDSNYLYIIYYKYIALFGQGRYEDAAILINELLKNWDILGEARESEMYSLLLSNYSIILEDRGEDVATIIPYVQETFNIDTKLFGRRSDKNITTLIRLSNLYKKQGNYIAALQYAKECVSISKDFLSFDDTNLATYLCILSETYSLTGNYQKSLEAAKDAASIYKRALGEKSEAYAKSLVNIALCYSDLSDFDSAINNVLQAIQICRSIDCQIVLRTAFDGIARIYHAKGDDLLAIRYGEESLKISVELGEQSGEPYMTILSNLAVYYSCIGDYQAAIDIHERKVDYARKKYGVNHPLYATTLSNLGATYLEMGEYKESYKCVLQALHIYKDNNDSIGYLNSLQGLALLSVETGNTSLALKYAKEAFALCKNVIGDYHPSYANCLSNLSQCYQACGNYERALDYEKEALAIREKLIGTHHPDYVHSLGDLATIYCALQEPKQALKYGLLNLNLIDSIYGPRHKAYASSLGNVAEYYSWLGDTQQAITMQEKAKDIYSQLFEDNSVFYATAMNNLANYYSEQGDYQKAINTQLKALSINKRLLGEYHERTLVGITNMSTYYERRGDYKNAIIYANDAIRKMQEKNVSLLGDLNTDVRTDYWNSINYIFFDFYPRLNYYDKVVDASLVYNSLLFAKGLLLNIELDIADAVTKSRNIIAIDLYKKLKHNRTFLYRLFKSQGKKKQAEIDSVSNLIWEQEEHLISLVKEYKEYTYSLKLKWDDVRSKLNDKDIALEFIHFSVNNDSVMYAALTLRKDSKYPKMTVLFEEKQLKEVSDTQYYYCQEMTDLVWKPLQSELKGIKNIYFSPSGALYNIGIEYLPGMENYNIYRLSSTRELVTRIDANPEKRAVLYGGLDYDAALDTLSKPKSIDILDYAFVDRANVEAVQRGMRIRGGQEKLKHSKEEVEQIGETLNNADWTCLLDTAKIGTEESFKALSGKRIGYLHIATHGFYYTPEEADNMQYRFIQLDNKHISAEDKALTRTGLLLSGANHILEGDSIPDDVEDGILTAKEIVDVDLRGLDLVVLSACQTGLGDISQGEGVFGLQRGFKKAGAKSILMSLWEVEDEVSQILMTQFYKNLLAGQGKRQALITAQQYLREYDGGKYDEPRYWAAFILLDGQE